jgi:hypothetical protein
MGCAASCMAGERLPGRAAGLASWSPEESAAWFATLPEDLKAYPQLATGAAGAPLARWDDAMLAAAGVANPSHRAQLRCWPSATWRPRRPRLTRRSR